MIYFDLYLYFQGTSYLRGYLKNHAIIKNKVYYVKVLSEIYKNKQTKANKSKQSKAKSHIKLL